MPDLYLSAEQTRTLHKQSEAYLEVMEKLIYQVMEM